MVTDGDTACEKCETGIPIPWLIVIVVAPWISQVRLDVPPAEMLAGTAVKELINGRAPSLIVPVATDVVAFCVPKLLLADKV